MVRRALPVLVLAALAAACTSSSSGSGSQNSLPTTTVPGNAALGLGADVTVTLDSAGIPYVQAASDADAAYATGYLHARNRLFQMDFFRRAGRGQLAAMLGPAALSQDEQIRTLFTSQTPTATGSYRIEDVLAENLTPDVKAVLQAYANGVNRFLADLAAGANGAQTPTEYIALNVADPTHPYKPTPWTIQDSLAVGRLQQWDLSSTLATEAAFGQVAQAFQAVQGACGPPSASCPFLPLFADLTRYAPARDAYIVPDASVAHVAGAVPLPAAVPGLGDALAKAADGLAKLHVLGKRGQVGSNNWVLDHTMVAGGAGTMVANDPHLSLSNPAIWYMIHVSSPTRNEGGFTFPGIPFPLIGHNDYIGWGQTVAGYDVTDLYYFPAASLGAPPLITPVTVPGGTIDVRGGSPVGFKVTIIPSYGSVIAAGNATTPFLTARWTGQEASNDFKAFLDLGAATSVYAAVSAMQYFEVGAQNFVVGDVDGNIAYYPHAYVPVRKAGCFTATVVPWAPMPGYDGSCVWTGRIADSDLPQLIDPAGHHVVTANNDITGITATNQPIQAGKNYLYPTRDLGYRATEAEARLSGKTGGYSLDDMTSVQADITSLFAADVVPGLLAWYQQAASDVTAKGLDGAVNVLKAWGTQASPYQTPTGLSTSDPASAPTSNAATLAAANASMLFHALVPRLASRILDPVLAQVTVGGAPLTSAGFSDMLSDEQLAKYLVALSIYAQGKTPTIPLLTGPASVCGASCAPQAVAALDDTVKFLSSAAVFGSATTTDWIWGRKHTVTFENYLAAGGSALFNYGPFARRGGLYTVDVANFSWSDDGASGFSVSSGPSVRFSAQMVKGNVKWRAVMPGGQSDYSSSSNYEDQVPAWLANSPGNLPWTAAEVEAAATSRLVLTP